MPKAEMYWIRWDDSYHRTFGDIHEHLSAREHPDALEIYECDRVYFEAPSVEAVAQELMEEFWLRLEGVKSFCHDWATAEAIAERCLEVLYFDVDDVSFVPRCKGVEKLQRAIDRFCFWNRPLFWLFGPHKWYNPGKWAIGLRKLRCALREFEWANRDKYVFEPNYEKGFKYVVLASEVSDE